MIARFTGTVRRAAAGATVALALAASCSGNSTGPASNASHPRGVVVGRTAAPGEPYGVAIDAGGTALVANVVSNQVLRFALPDTVAVSADSLPSGSGPVHLAIDPAGTRAYVVEQFGEAVDVIDLATNHSVASVPLTNTGFNVAVRPDGQRVYATTADGRVYVIATATSAIIDSLLVGPAANGLAFSPDGRVLYISSRDSGNVAAFSTTTDVRVGTYTVGGRPQRLAVSPDGSHLYVANEISGLNVVDLASPGTPVSDSAYGGGYGLGVTPDGAQIYLTIPSSGMVIILNRASLELVSALSLGGVPRNVAFSADGTSAIVTDGSGSIVFLK